jgi:enoyl-CoA hydratase/carnithine racemase
MEVCMTELLEERNGPIYTLTLNRPEKRNALPFEMLGDICQKVEDLIVDPEIRGIIIKGNGKVFSAGVDFDSLGMLAGHFLGDQAAGGAPIRAVVYKYQQYLNRLESIEIPIVCAMHGAVFGMAVGATKKIINRGEGVDLMTQLDMEVSYQSILLRSEDFQEGVTALMERRDPVWKRK